jgi:putative hydrolase of the HAD superfamily
MKLKGAFLALMKPQTILFDLDDTLIHCNKYFFDALDRFAVRLQAYLSHNKSQGKVRTKDIQDKQLELDMIGVQKYGFVKERFPESLIETYHYFRNTFNLHKDSAFEEELWNLGMKVYRQEYEPYPHMNETLEALKREGHELHLYTGGDVSIQNFKVEQTELRKFFDDRIYVTPHKTADYMNKVIEEKRFDRDHTWMVGNSARTDVVPALQNGIHAIFIPVEQEWHYNQVEITDTPKGAFLTLGSLQQVPAAIKEFRASLI